MKELRINLDYLATTYGLTDPIVARVEANDAGDWTLILQGEVAAP